MIDFLKAYWREILEVVILLASIVICCIKKRPVKVVDTLRELILQLLPGCINASEIEAAGLPGKDKKEYAINLLLEVLQGQGYGDDTIAPYLPFIKSQVEVILSTPQKKVR